MGDGYGLIMATLKLLKWIEEKLPDKPRLGFLLLVIGAVIVGLTPLLLSQDRGSDVDDFRAVWFFLGGTCGVLGGYILFRRAVWMWQEKRAPRITTLHLK